MGPASLVLFDLDGTLLDGSGLPAAMRATCAVVAEHLPDATAQDLVAANTAAWQRIWPEAEDAYMLGGEPGDRVGRRAWEETLRACGSDDPALVDLAEQEWARQERRALRLFDDVLPALDALEAAGVRVGMITNGAASVQRRKLGAVGLVERLDPLVISGETGIRKPDPVIFEIALHRAAVTPDRAWFVGDHLWHDVQAADAAGLHTAWIDRREDDAALDPAWPRPEAVLRSLALLPPLLERSGQDPR